MEIDLEFVSCQAETNLSSSGVMVTGPRYPSALHTSVFGSEKANAALIGRTRP